MYMVQPVEIGLTMRPSHSWICDNYLHYFENWTTVWFCITWVSQYLSIKSNSCIFEYNPLKCDSTLDPLGRTALLNTSNWKWTSCLLDLVSINLGWELRWNFVVFGLDFKPNFVVFVFEWFSRLHGSFEVFFLALD